MNAGQDGFRDTSSKHSGGQQADHWLYRSVPCRGSIDHTICSLSCKFWHRLSTVAVQLLPVSGQSLDRACRAGGTDFVCVLLLCHPQLPSVAFHVVPRWLNVWRAPYAPAKSAAMDVAP